MSTFIIMINRIAAELRRSNITAEIKNGINDAITEAAKTRFYFNEMHVSFPTVVGQEYYSDMGLIELDDVWFFQNGTVNGQKERIHLSNQLDANDYRIGNAQGGQLDGISRYGGQLRIRPVPTSVQTIYLDGYGKLIPNPLVADADTNAWLTEGELYIRALAKRNVLRDVIRDYGEARVADAIAEDYKDMLISDTAMRSGGDDIRPTQW